MTTINIGVHSKLSFIVMFKLLVIGNCLNITNVNFSNKVFIGNQNITNVNSLNNVNSLQKDGTLPIDTIFTGTPSPTWPQGGNFSTYEIDLGGLQVTQISGFEKIYTAYEGGPDNLGVTFFEPPSVPGFFMLGAYAQQNNQPLSGWVLMGKTNANDKSDEILKQPIDYTIQLMMIAPQSTAYLWLPIPPDGYKSVGLLVTSSPDKPSLDRIRCVRSDFTDEAETDTWIWGKGGFNVYGLRPKTRGTNAKPLSVGTFIVTSDQNNAVYLSVLKNNNPEVTCNPNLEQVRALFQEYSPLIYSHPDEKYHPSSVNWFFKNGALLYTKGYESNPVPIEMDGANLPQGGSNDGFHWLDLPADGQARGNIVKGDLQTAEVYLHVKPVLGSTFTDIQVWVFYPFNGHAVAKLAIIKKIPLGNIGKHVGDWEHVTLRISNFNGDLWKVFFAEHNRGTWVDSSMLNYQKGSKFAVFASLNGHASYYRPGNVLLGGGKDVGIRDETWWSEAVFDTGMRYQVVAGEGLGVASPPWLGFKKQWGPNVTFDFWTEVRKMERVMIGPLKKEFRKFMNSLPPELYGQKGPTGPTNKDNWDGDEN
ncbi:hypothetical protein CASFOL_021637 [Castilleja foliolosa]|uniref:DUF946 domain-containing protein n=1 Tax=Castilleja foliolosa TaxID=1961234 RepID=A0ABD3CX63_9LAMI